jgi:dipeptidyl aminopeptidase/acylaminoacyl peptidase
MFFDGGEARPLTDLKGQFGSFEWSPDGRKLICQFRSKDAAVLEREADEQKEKLGIVSRRVTRLFYKADAQGFVPEEKWHLWIIDVRTGRATQLTDGPYDESEPTWSPDGQSIAFTSNRVDDPDSHPSRADLCIVSADGGDVRVIDTPEGAKSSPVFSPDGQMLAYYCSEGSKQFWLNTDLWTVPVDGGAAALNLTAQFDCNIGASTIDDSAAIPPVQQPIWSNDGQSLFFQVSRHGSTTLQVVDATGESASYRTLLGGENVVGMVSFDCAKERVAYLLADAASPGELWTQPIAGGSSRRLTLVNANLLRSRDLGKPEEVWFKGPAGNDLQGWVLKPTDFDPNEKYPAILEIHGGPQMQYGNLFMHEFQYLAANGYVVFYTNPRGSQGYGNEHVDAIVGDYAAIAYNDLMAWTDYVVKQPYVDGDRLGVTGGSYGGYMTNWIIGQTDRFKAAVTQRSLSNLVSMNGTSDFNWIFQFWQGDVAPWENVEQYWQQSPMKYVADVVTPTMIIHSESDLRVEIEQGEQLFVALKRLGVDTEMIRFPDESHGLSRAGRTDRRVDRLQHILRWFDLYLKVG